MKKNIMDKYIIGIIIVVSLVIYYMYGLDEVLFFLTINIFTFSLTRDLKMVVPFVLITTYLYINYLDSSVEGFKGFKKGKNRKKKARRAARKATTAAAAVLGSTSTGGNTLNNTTTTDNSVAPVDTSTSDTISFTSPPTSLPNIINTQDTTRSNVGKSGTSSSTKSSVSKVIRQSSNKPEINIEKAIVGSVSQDRAQDRTQDRMERNNNRGQQIDPTLRRGNGTPGEVITEFNRINKSTIQSAMTNKPGKLKGSDQIVSAYENLQNFLGTEAMNGMAIESKNLAQKQKDLMDQMNTLAPVVNNYTKMMNGFDSSKLSDIIGGLNNMMASTKVPT
jgi:hypothetical protein